MFTSRKTLLNMEDDGDSSVLFNSSNTYVAIGDTLNTELDSFSSFTLAFWVYVIPSSTVQTIFNVRKDSNEYLWFYENAGAITWRFKNASDTDNVAANSAGKIPFYTWTHVALTADGSGGSSRTCVQYNNGVAQTMSTNTTDIDITIGTAGHAQVGAINGGTSWGGYMSDIALYGANLSAANIVTLYNQGEYFDHNNDPNKISNLKLWYKMGEGDGYGSNEVIDHSDSNFHGTLNNALITEFSPGDE